MSIPRFSILVSTPCRINSWGWTATLFHYPYRGAASWPAITSMGHELGHSTRESALDECEDVLNTVLGVGQWEFVKS